MVDTATRHSPNSSTRPAGRPRSSKLDSAIADATLELLGERGYSGCSISGIAERAGTTTAAIYRRWNSKPELVSRIVFHTDTETAVHDTGDLHSDVTSMVVDAVDRLAHPVAVAAIGGLLSEPRDAREERSAEWTGASAPVVERLRRAQDAGELRADVDCRVMESMITGPVLQRTLMGHAEPANDEWIEQLVSVILDGAAP